MKLVQFVSQYVIEAGNNIVAPNNPVTSFVLFFFNMRNTDLPIQI